MNKLEISSPWVTYVRQIKLLFGQDPAIKITFDENNLNLKLYVSGEKKAIAIEELLPDKIVFGNVVLTISVIPIDVRMLKQVSKVFEAAFEGNPIFKEVVNVNGISSNDSTYVIFKNKVAQYWNDNLCDPNGLCSTLYQDVAKEVLTKLNDVYYCTEPGNDVVRCSCK